MDSKIYQNTENSTQLHFLQITIWLPDTSFRQKNF